MISKKELIAAPVTIFNRNNRINEYEMEQLIKKILREGADGLFVGGSVGECFLVSMEERIRLFELASKYLKEAKVYAHVGTISTDQAVEMTKAALSCGITEIASTPPFYFSFTTKEIAGYFYDLAEAAGKPVLYYDIPSSTHKDLNTNDPEIRAMLKSGAIGAIKHTNLLSYRAKAITAINPDIKIMGGFESRMIPMLNDNCDGFIGSTFNFMLPQYQKVIEAYSSQNKSKLYQYITDCTDVLNVLLKVGLPAAIKYILTKQGIEAGEVRKPLLPLDESAKQLLDQTIATKLF